MRDFKPKKLMFVCRREKARRTAVLFECYKKTAGGRFAGKELELGESVDTEPSLVPPLPKPEEMTGGQWTEQWIISEEL